MQRRGLRRKAIPRLRDLVQNEDVILRLHSLFFYAACLYQFSIKMGIIPLSPWKVLRSYVTLLPEVASVYYGIYRDCGQ